MTCIPCSTGHETCYGCCCYSSSQVPLLLLPTRICCSVLLLLLTGEWVDVSCCVPNDEQVVVMCGVEALAAQAQCCCTHALQLGVGAQRSRDEGVLCCEAGGSAGRG